MDRVKRLIPLLGFAVFALAVWAGHRELRTVHYQDVVNAFSSFPVASLLGALAFSALSYITLIIGEHRALTYAGRPDVPWRTTAFVSFVASVVSHNIGFSVLSGTPIRYRFYSLYGFSALDLAKVMAFNAASFWLGIFALGGVSLLFFPTEAIFGGIPPQLLGVIFLVVTASYLLLSTLHRKHFQIRSWTISVPAPRMAWSQLALSFVDWLAVALSMYLLLPASIHVDPAHFCAAFLAAQVAGMVSQVPGGLGVFEGALLVAIGSPSINHELVASLLIFRFVYYLMPLGLAGAMLGFFEIRHRKAFLERARTLMEETVLEVIPIVFSATVFMAGIILLLSGATPTLPLRLAWLERLLPLPLLEMSHLVGSVVGVLLIVLSRGLMRRLELAWALTMLLLLVGAAASLLKGVDYEEALALLMQAVLLAPCKKVFFRKSHALRDLRPSWLAMLLAVTISLSFVVGFASQKNANWSSEMWWTFAFSEDAPRFLRASLAVSLTSGVVLLWQALTFVRKPDLQRHLSLEEVEKIVEMFPSSFSWLALSGDKDFFPSASFKAFLMYRVEGRSWVALGDPVGDPKEFSDLVWEFREAALRHGCNPVFYQVQLKYAHLYVDLGLTLTKLGEEALVPLKGFSLEGTSRKDFRRALRRAEDEGLSFEIVARENVSELLPALRVVSDDWLREKNAKEKGFSLGHFDEVYLAKFPFAVIRARGQIIAFANLWTAQNREELSIDLMRYSSSAPRGIMDYLFVKLLLWGSGEGYSWFNLGMAPLSGIENRPDAPAWNRFATFIFRHGERYYNFHGLRAYKEKFDPVWRPLYLACPGGFAFPRVLADVTFLISGGAKGIVSK